ncbi:MAG: hypothetical protein PVI90_11765 [Desulfobacteraceae bacterium]|jgi:hypothetical protein
MNELECLKIAARMLQCEVKQIDPRLVEEIKNTNKLVNAGGGELLSRQVIACIITTREIRFGWNPVVK